MSGFDLSTAFGDVQAAIANGTFDPVGLNYTSFMPPQLPGLPQMSGTTLGNSNSGTISSATKAINDAAASMGVSPASNFPAAIAAGTPSTPTAGASKNSGSIIASYFTRAVIIILGFIFVGAGLVMFKPVQGVVPGAA